MDTVKEKLEKNTVILDVDKIKLTCEKKEEVKEKKKKKKKRSKRCAQCKKRVGSFGITCKCGNLYCGIHRYASEHNCTWDYRSEQCKIIREGNPDMSFKKIDTI